MEVNIACKVYTYLMDRRFDLAIKEVEAVSRQEYEKMIKPVLKDLLKGSKDRISYQLFNVLNIVVFNIDYDYEYKVDYELFSMANRIADMAMLDDDSHTLQEIDNALGNCDIVKLELEKLRTKLK